MCHVLFQSLVSEDVRLLPLPLFMDSVVGLPASWLVLDRRRRMVFIIECSLGGVLPLPLLSCFSMSSAEVAVAAPRVALVLAHRVAAASSLPSVR